MNQNVQEHCALFCFIPIFEIFKRALTRFKKFMEVQGEIMEVKEEAVLFPSLPLWQPI